MPPPARVDRGFADTVTVAGRCDCRYDKMRVNGVVTRLIEVDIKALTVESPELISQLGPAFEKYNEEQFATVKLPGGSQQVGLWTVWWSTIGRG